MIMETEMIDKQPRKRFGLIILIVFILVFLIYYSVMSFLSPGRTLARIVMSMLLNRMKRPKLMKGSFLIQHF